MIKKELLDAIVDVYSAPGSVTGWEHALGAITNLVGCKSSGFIFVNNANNYVELSISVGYSKDLMDSYSGITGAVNDDVRYKYRHNLIPGQVFREREFIESRHDWNTMPWNIFEREKMGIYYCMSALISTHGVWSDYISVNRLESRGPNTDAEKSDLQQLLPHLSRAGDLNRLVNRLHEQFGLVLSVLDRLMIGVVIIDPQGRVVTANASVSEIASNSGAFRIASGRFKLKSAEAAGRFSNILQRCISTANGHGNSQGGDMVLDCHSEQHKVVLDIMPLRDDGFSDGDRVKGAVVFVLDPALDYPFSVTGLRDIFKLTNSETQVTELLVNGCDVKQIAEQRNTQPATIRDQLKSIYQKTGTSGQLDLLRKAVKANLPIKSD